MAETENAATLLAKKEYAKAAPLLKADLDKYPNNPRIRLQYADALAGSGSFDDAVTQYEATAKYYDDNGLTVQAIAVRKKADKVREHVGKGGAKSSTAAGPASPSEPVFKKKVSKSPLFE